MLIEGVWYRQGNAQKVAATLNVSETTYVLKTEEGDTSSDQLEGISVSERLGNTERKLTLQDGSVFATRDNDSIDQIFKRKYRFNILLHAMESHVGWVAFACVATLLFVIAFFQWGVPLGSSALASALPHKTNELISKGGFDFLDKFVFEESKLDIDTQARIREHFRSELRPLDTNHPEIKYKLHFREWDMLGEEVPNALALPSGDIILTDAFVNIAENQREIDSVILHEMGHVVNRHGLKSVIQGVAVTTFVMLATGDNSAIADAGLGLGSLMVSSNYSRGHETEADQYAFNKMLEAGIDPKSFSDILSRMTGYSRTDLEDISNTEDKYADYLSSHPSTPERVAMANRYGECYQKKITNCVVE